MLYFPDLLTNDEEIEDITRTMRARLITYNEAKLLGCTTTTKSCPNYMSSDEVYYWSSTAYSNSKYFSAWIVDVSPRLGFYSVSTSATVGVRPVIELSK